MVRLIKSDLVEGALLRLATSARATAAARAIRLRAEFRRKRAFAKAFFDSQATSDKRREYDAAMSDTFAKAVEEECEAVERDELLRAERSDAAIILDVYRTEEASERAGRDFR